MQLNRQARELRDLQDELAGRVTGRPTRFFSENSDGDTKRGKDRKREREELSALRRLLASDPVYAARYEAVDDKLTNAESAAVAVLMQLNEAAETVAAELERMQEQAPQLHDGTRVYLTKDGFAAYTEDGRLLTPEEMDSIDWPEDAPAWEDYEAQRRKLERIEAERQKVIQYQKDVLDPAREQLSDEDDPPSLEDLDEIDQAIDDKQPDSIAAYRRDPAGFDVNEAISPAELSQQIDTETLPDLDLPPPIGPRT